jgi:hypothetical protein
MKLSLKEERWILALGYYRNVEGRGAGLRALISWRYMPAEALAPGRFTHAERVEKYRPDVRTSRLRVGCEANNLTSEYIYIYIYTCTWYIYYET